MNKVANKEPPPPPEKAPPIMALGKIPIPSLKLMPKIPAPVDAAPLEQPMLQFGPPSFKLDLTSVAKPAGFQMKLNRGSLDPATRLEGHMVEEEKKESKPPTHKNLLELASAKKDSA